MLNSFVNYWWGDRDVKIFFFFKSWPPTFINLRHRHCKKVIYKGAPWINIYNWKTIKKIYKKKVVQWTKAGTFDFSFFSAHGVQEWFPKLNQLQSTMWFLILPYHILKVKGAQSCPILCNPTDYTVPGILQARTLEWVTNPFSCRSSWPRRILYQLSYQRRPLQHPTRSNSRSRVNFKMEWQHIENGIKIQQGDFRPLLK